MNKIGLAVLVVALVVASLLQPIYDSFVAFGLGPLLLAIFARFLVEGLGIVNSYLDFSFVSKLSNVLDVMGQYFFALNSIWMPLCPADADATILLVHGSVIGILYILLQFSVGVVKLFVLRCLVIVYIIFVRRNIVKAPVKSKMQFVVVFILTLGFPLVYLTMYALAEVDYLGFPFCDYINPGLMQDLAIGLWTLGTVLMLG